MFKRIGLSAAAILAVVALAKPPVAMAADRDDFGYGHRDDQRRNVQESRDYRERDYRERIDRRRPDWRHENRDRDWR